MNEDDAALRNRVTRLAQIWRPGLAVTSFAPLVGGHSSRTYLAEIAGDAAQRLVVKVAPAGIAPTRNRDVLRQARALKAIGGNAGIPVPEVLFEDEGAPVEVPPLFAMSYVAGECVEPALDILADVALPGPSDVRDRALDAARMLGSLHTLEPASIGLADVSETTLEDEIARWATLLGTIEDTDLIAGVDDVHAALRKTMPAPTAPRLLHGDYRLGNTLCTKGAVLAVIDWEIWSIGDPRTDLAWFLLSAQPDRHPSALRKDVGFPSVPELLDAYGAKITDAELDWFQALQLFKMAAASALIAKNLTRRGSDPETLARTRTTIPQMISGARALID